MRFKLKLSLRSLFIILTVVVIVFGLRYQRRVRIQIATQKIKELGGEVFLTCQEPEADTFSQTLSNYYLHVSRNGGNMITVSSFTATKSEQSRPWLTAFLFGTTDDVEVSAVSIPAAAVDDETVRLLQQLGGVEMVLLLLSKDYLSVKHSTRSTAEMRKIQIERLGEDFERATALIEQGLPSVALYQGVDNESTSTCVLVPEN